MIRDTYSKALVATDVNELQQYRSQKKRERELLQIKEDIKSIKQCINRMTESLQKLESRYGQN